jgi:hypothetical protein
MRLVRHFVNWYKFIEAHYNTIPYTRIHSSTYISPFVSLLQILVRYMLISQASRNNLLAKLQQQQQQANSSSRSSPGSPISRASRHHHQHQLQQQHAGEGGRQQQQQQQPVILPPLPVRVKYIGFLLCKVKLHLILHVLILLLLREQLRRRFPGLGRRRGGGIVAPRLFSLQAICQAAAQGMASSESDTISGAGAGGGGGGGHLRPTTVSKSTSFTNLKIGQQIYHFYSIKF